MRSFLNEIKTNRALKKLLGIIQNSRGYDTSSSGQMKWAINTLSLDAANHFISILQGENELLVEALTSAAYGKSPKLSYRAIHDHYEYALSVSDNKGWRAMKTITEAIDSFGLAQEQERALIRLEASRKEAEAGWNNGTFPVRRRHYSGLIRAAVQERPDKVEQIIEIAATKPDIRAVELVELLKNATPVPLSEGIL